MLSQITINNFEEMINYTILKRGYNYYKNNNVVELKIDQYQVKALVMGRELYNVYIKINQDLDIVSSMCNCPYVGLICKHQVAVYYSIRELPVLQSPKEVLLKPKLRDLKNELKDKTKDELTNIILNLTKNQPVLMSKALALTKSKYKSVFLVETIDLYLGNDGNNIDAYLGVDLIFDWIKEEKNNSLEHLMALIDAQMKIINLKSAHLANPLNLVSDYYDFFDYHYSYDDYDENYFKGDEYLEKIQIIISNLIKEIVETNAYDASVVEYVTMLLKSNNFNLDMDETLTLIRSFMPLAKYKDIYDELINFIDLIVKIKPIRYLLQLKYDLLNTFSSNKSALAYAKAHIQYNEFRELVIKDLFIKKDYHQVILLTLELINNENNNIYDLKWYEYLNQAYVLLDDTTNIRKTSLYLFLGNKYEYFNVYKNTYDKVSWEEGYLELKKQIINNIPLYKHILIKEAQWDELYELICSKNHLISSCYKYFPATYNKAIIDLITKSIHEDMKTSKSRKAYEKLSSKFNIITGILDEKALLTYIKDMKTHYSNRPAFLAFLDTI